MNPDHSPQVDQELLHQLEMAESDHNLVQAVFALRPPRADQKFVSPDQAEIMTRQVLDRVQQETGESAQDWNVFKNLGSFVVAAPARFIRKLLEQDEIASALANRQSRSLLVSPHRKKPVPLRR